MTSELPGTPSPFAGDEHDHRDCIAEALTAAAELCRQRGERLTPLRSRVLELVWASHKPVGAYAVLEKLREAGSAAPPTVYRALDFLQQQGLVHRIASLNAYVGCHRPGAPHAAQFLICASCQELAELDDSQISEAIKERAEAAGFAVQRPTVEVLGLCPRCREEKQ